MPFSPHTAETLNYPALLTLEMQSDSLRRDCVRDYVKAYQKAYMQAHSLELIPRYFLSLAARSMEESFCTCINNPNMGIHKTVLLNGTLSIPLSLLLMLMEMVVKRLSAMVLIEPFEILPEPS